MGKGHLTIGDRDPLVLTRYEIDDVVGPQFDASIVVLNSVIGTARIDDDGRGIVDLFRFVAAHWNGWDGPVAWRSSDDGLRLSLEYQRLGHIEVAATLVPNGPDGPPLKTHTELLAGVTRLKALADDAAIFFRLASTDPSARFIEGCGALASPQLNASLRAFYAEWKRLPPDLLGIRAALIRLFALLAAPEHRSDAACSYTSAYVRFCLEDRYSPFAERSDDEMEQIPDDLWAIISAVCENLDKTIAKPAIAEDFGATPEQLLARVRALSL